MKKLVSLAFIGVIGIALVGCSGNDDSASQKKEEISEIFSEKKEHIDVTGINIPEEVIKVSESNIDNSEFIPVDQLKVITGEYEDGIKPIVELIKSGDVENLNAILDDSGNLIKYIYYGNTVNRDSFLLSIDSSTTMTDILEIFINNDNFEQTYNSDLFTYEIRHNPDNIDKTWTTSIIAIKK
ncbi:hypothetical protein AB6889_02300 [Carnobacterium maltaromaticum]|uniref:hypothetical protein n=1 Tax=Carnobacterium maltaromaticum TaxID=2751 RepID=UPI0039BEBA02